MASELSDIGLYGLAVMGQNLALNIGSKGFSISVCNRSPAKVDVCVKRAKEEGVNNLTGFKDLKEFVNSIKKPRNIILLVKAGPPVENVINLLVPLLEKGDMIIDGGNEWYENTERRGKQVGEHGILYMGMGVSGGEEGARNGPSLMPGGPREGYDRVEKILKATAAKTKDGTICVNYLGRGGSGNYIKMVHNGIEYGDMQLIAEAYDLMKIVCKYDNVQIGKIFDEWNKGELESFLVEITANIFKKKDDRGDPNGFLVDQVLDRTANKGTGKWTVKEAAEQGCAAPTISAALNGRYISWLKEERLAASKVLQGPESRLSITEKEKFVDDLRKALYAAKICSYAQGMTLIKTMGENMEWKLNMGAIASLWKGGCIIRARFLDRITEAYTKEPNLKNLLVAGDFAKELNERQAAWRKVICVAVQDGIPVPAFSGSLAYYDSYRRARLPANLTQAQRDYFGAHTYERVGGDIPADTGAVYKSGTKVHSEWAKPTSRM